MASRTVMRPPVAPVAVSVDPCRTSLGRSARSVHGRRRTLAPDGALGAGPGRDRSPPPAARPMRRRRGSPPRARLDPGRAAARTVPASRARQRRCSGLGTWVLLLAILLATRAAAGPGPDRGGRRCSRRSSSTRSRGWLHVYVYRLHDVPAFVPPGHGLVYLAALALGGTALVRRHCAGAAVAATVVVGRRVRALGAQPAGAPARRARRVLVRLPARVPGAAAAPGCCTSARSWS